MSFRIKLLCLLAMLAATMYISPEAKAQRIALKTNTIDWAILSPNATLETRLSRRVSLQVGLSCNPFKFRVFDTRLSNFRVEPEVRYWFNRPMARHFLALSGTMAMIHFAHNNHNFVGDAVAGGVSYGYAHELSRHWNLEAEIGVGLVRLHGKDYHTPVAPSGNNYAKWHIAPIRAAVSFSYIFK